MKKIFYFLISLFFLILISLVVVLSTIGVETKKFNDLISKKINQTNNNINLKLNKIKFKIDLKEISLFLKTTNPQIVYRDTNIPAQNIKVYVDFISLIKSNPKIKKINLSIEEIDIKKLKQLLTTIKPSNFKSLINNKIKKGKLILELEAYFDKDNYLDNFIARGSASNLEANITKDLYFKNTNFNFFADKTDVLIKNIFGETESIGVTEGDLRLKLSQEILLETNFKSKLNLNKNSLNKNYFIKKNSQYFKGINNLQLELNNYISVSFDKTYKVTDYNYKGNGQLVNALFYFDVPITNYFSDQKINQLQVKNSKIRINFNSNKNNLIISGKYSINNSKFSSFNLENATNVNLSNLNLNIDYNEGFNLDFINYKKTIDAQANLQINISKKKKDIIIEKIKFLEGKNLILVENLKAYKDQLLSFDKISIKTNKDGEINNDFAISYGKKIKIKGSKFDATNLPRFFSQKTKNNSLSQISKKIEVDFKNVEAPVSENLNNFKLIGEIKKGKFTKISSKGDFGDNNFLDITMKNDQNSKKKYLEIYSDLPKPLLTEFNFFKGLTGGKLLFTSIIDETSSNSKLKIENFKVVNAPGMVKLLSLADLGGLADLAKGEGLSFDLLEINMNKNKNILKLDEILALGPSISVLMEGYQDENGLTSLRGTLVPAKNLNKMISKIPVLGDIIIPKEVGEGLFGISFKMKGQSGDIKTTINPIKTLTPRFIQKIIDKNKNKNSK
jgi:hypothetical protein